MIDDQIENKIILSIKKFYQKDFIYLKYKQHRSKKRIGKY